MCATKLIGRLAWGMLLLCAATGTFATDADPTPATPMKMDEPMPTKMARPGMKKGEVRKAAEKKDREMKPMMDGEAAASAAKK